MHRVSQTSIGLMAVHVCPNLSHADQVSKLFGLAGNQGGGGGPEGRGRGPLGGLGKLPTPRDAPNIRIDAPNGFRIDAPMRFRIDAFNSAFRICTSAIVV